MRSKQEILAEVEEALRLGILEEADLTPFATVPSQAVVAVEVKKPQEPARKKLSAVDVMFYVAGIVLFSTIMSAIVQSWEDGNPFVHILLSAGVGLALWAAAYFLIKNSTQSDIRRGLINALLLTGSLCVVVGGYIITNELIGGFDEVNFIPFAVTLVIMGAVHIGFDRLIKRNLVLRMGIFLCVAAFPTLMFGLLEKSNLPIDVWAAIMVVTAILLVYATRVVAKMNPDRDKFDRSFDSFGAFLALASMYSASHGDNGIWWLLALIAAVFGIFYLSIISQNKHLLGNGSFFLVVTVITIAFKYFSGYGITLSLIIATIGLLGSAAVASIINKKYFKSQVPESTAQPVVQSADSTNNGGQATGS